MLYLNYKKGLKSAQSLISSLPLGVDATGFEPAAPTSLKRINVFYLVFFVLVVCYSVLFRL